MFLIHTVFETRFGILELLKMEAKLHTFKNIIYRAVAFTSVLKNPFEVRRSAFIFLTEFEVTKMMNKQI